MKRWFIITALTAALLLLAGCGAGGSGGSEESADNEARNAQDIGSPEPGAEIPAAEPDTPMSSNPDASASDGGSDGAATGGAAPGSGNAGGGVSGSAGGGSGVLQPAATADEASAAVIGALAARDLEALKAYAHPERGILFSPYGHIDTETALVFKADELPAFDDGMVRTWGAYDGSGAPIELTFAEYFDKFLFNHDYTAAEQIGRNEILGQGNTIVNIADVFPGSTTFDYYFSGFNPEFEGMDWSSLILVLEQHEGAWYVSAVVHSQWTI